jgi:hypothetical protein
MDTVSPHRRPITDQPAMPPDMHVDSDAGRAVYAFLHVDGFDPDKQHAIVYDWKKSRHAEDDNDDRVVTHPHVAALKKAWGGAPFVGRPFLYQWWVAVDTKTNEQVASSASVIRYIPEEIW